MMREYVAGFAYSLGVYMVGETLHWHFLTGAGVWLIGWGLLLMVEAYYD